jgi:lipoyl(octanoyl) transferase
VPVADSAVSHSPIAMQRAGMMDYLDALELQRSLHREIADGVRENTLILLEHPSVFTAGKRTQMHERPTDGSVVIDVDRGGKITWHGPGQLVGYPIVRLAKPTELVGFVREIESALISICQELASRPNALKVAPESG